MASSSYTKSSKAAAAKKELTRRGSVLDEYKIYFSNWLSPLRKKRARKQKINNGGAPQEMGNYKAKEDVDSEADKFIAMKHKNFELSKWASTD